MDKLSFRIKGYHAIHSAEISLDGISVVAGINGCGKSTISRWLYYLVNGVNGYEEYRLNQLADWGNSTILWLGRLVFPVSSNKREGLQFCDSIEDMNALFLKKIEYAKVQNMQGALRGDSTPLIRNSILSRLNIPQSASDSEIMQALDNEFYEVRGMWDSKVKAIKETPVGANELKKTIVEHFGIVEDFPLDINLIKLGDELVHNDAIIPSYTITKAIYIDSAMGFMDSNDNIYHYNRELSILLDKANRDTTSNKEKVGQLSQLISQAIGGKVTLAETDWGGQELCYESSEGMKIPIKQAATGIKSFAMLSRLIENGHLDEHTLLIIDEPESHLHPQWVVEYARLLVLINKVIGTRIVVASHDPDMVEAIASISEKEGVTDNCHFYLAELETSKDSQTGQMHIGTTYQFRDLGQQIGDIFASFGLAQSKIDMYTLA